MITLFIEITDSDFQRQRNYKIFQRKRYSLVTKYIIEKILFL
ncbi:hypothetical protein HMPREF0766_13046 [Sphingobacterium spiritivorum ATCC 33861]|uniref:Uncharacterized protein n=1 Tax=Sphingobacterium spiritivorum ATCC 33861 TaxID=525373 RepID=D7VPZ2_SPHSI|nr:hypothetical protein HMPREF0766_13046 [Sphingobacterium spiritivorum ATCC 33861]